MRKRLNRKRQSTEGQAPMAPGVPGSETAPLAEPTTPRPPLPPLPTRRRWPGRTRSWTTPSSSVTCVPGRKPIFEGGSFVASGVISMGLSICNSPS